MHVTAPNLPMEHTKLYAELWLHRIYASQRLEVKNKKGRTWIFDDEVQVFNTEEHT